MKTHQIIFSPTGGTERVCRYICEGIGRENVVTDLCLKDGEMVVPEISEDDLVVIAMPVFAGRVPALAVERLRRIKNNRAKCVVVAVYGNRAYDDALLEMQDVATDMGFIVIAAVGAIAEHSIARVYGYGRPGEEDRKQLVSFGADIMKKAEGTNFGNALLLPGSRPYKPHNVGPFPEANEQCNGCGLCSDRCPVNAIPAGNPRSVNKNLCISCMRCVSVCPSKARSIGQLEAVLTEKLKPLCSAEKHNELFI